MSGVLYDRAQNGRGLVKPNGSGRPSRPADNRIIREEETLARKNRKGQVKTAEERVTPEGNRPTMERRLRKRM